MPNFFHTPEALLGRNDSKNPATTCKGITSSGRPCRRALAATKISPITRRKSNNNSALGGVLAIVQEDGEIQEADFYCWQHKDQAEQRRQEDENNARPFRKGKRRSTELFPLKERSSIDTMVQKLGLDAIEESQNAKPTRNPKPPRKTQTNDFASRPSQAPYAEKYNLGSAAQRPRPATRRPGFWASLCCMTSDDDDYVEIVRHRKRTEQAQAVYDRPQVAMATPTNTTVPVRNPVKPSNDLHSPPGIQAHNAQTSNLLSLIPGSLSPQTTSALLTELTKPISAYDEEGYIYIFWLTPQSKTAPGESTARSLLAPPDTNQRPRHGRRVSDVMTEYSFVDEPQSSRAFGQKGTIMLKIGRANNITRRMNEWQRQCGYALNLVRWYPYVSSTPQPSPRASPQREVLYPDLSRPPTGHRQSSDTVHKVPCVKRVERLIHLELAEKQVKRQCTACGKEHREWFEVDASNAGIRAVDEAVRRWVRWGEAQS